mmetsp:Transcript_20380/g.57909  ORF Transcript_20380/g.57909 Transcript_20380/m.57909 type:complete len:496 (-) Transcript_20380:1932-3419(-)
MSGEKALSTLLDNLSALVKYDFDDDPLRTFCTVDRKMRNPFQYFDGISLEFMYNTRLAEALRAFVVLSCAYETYEYHWTCVEKVREGLQRMFQDFDVKVQDEAMSLLKDDKVPTQPLIAMATRVEVIVDGRNIQHDVVEIPASKFPPELFGIDQTARDKNGDLCPTIHGLDVNVRGLEKSLRPTDVQWEYRFDKMCIYQAGSSLEKHVDKLLAADMPLGSGEHVANLIVQFLCDSEGGRITIERADGQRSYTFHMSKDSYSKQAILFQAGSAFSVENASEGSLCLLHYRAFEKRVDHEYTELSNEGECWYSALKNKPHHLRSEDIGYSTSAIGQPSLDADYLVRMESRVPMLLNEIDGFFECRPDKRLGVMMYATYVVGSLEGDDPSRTSAMLRTADRWLYEVLSRKRDVWGISFRHLLIQSSRRHNACNGVGAYVITSSITRPAIPHASSGSKGEKEIVLLYDDRARVKSINLYTGGPIRDRNFSASCIVIEKK